MTEAVKELESDLGAALLERSGRGVSLTHAASSSSATPAASSKPSPMRGARCPATTSPAGELHLGASSLVAGYILADLLARFRRAFPGVAVAAVEDSGEYLEHLLVNGELDVAVMVVSRLREPAALEARILEESAYRLWLPLGHPLAAREGVSLADVAAEQQIMLTSTRSRRRPRPSGATTASGPRSPSAPARSRRCAASSPPAPASPCCPTSSTGRGRWKATASRRGRWSSRCRRSGSASSGGAARACPSGARFLDVVLPPAATRLSYRHFRYQRFCNFVFAMDRGAEAHFASSGRGPRACARADAAAAEQGRFR